MNTSRIFKFSLFYSLVLGALFMTPFLAPIARSLAAFIFGLGLMLISYVMLGLSCSALLSYLAKIAHHALRSVFSVQARLAQQRILFERKKSVLQARHQRRSAFLKQKYSRRQQKLYDANTKVQARDLAQKTNSKLHSYRSVIPAELRNSNKQAIRQCVSQRDMGELIKISYAVSKTIETLPHPQGSTKME